MDAIVLEENYHRTPTELGQQPVDLLRVATAPAAPAVTAMSYPMVMRVAEAVAAGAPHTELAGEPAAGAIAEAEATQTATPLVSHVAATMPAKKLKNYDAKKVLHGRPQRRLPRLLCSALQSASPGEIQTPGITKYDAKQDPVQWLRCYALSIENAGGNNDTKCLYFPFCLDQAPLTWLESLEKYSIDEWDQLKEQFTSNFAGAMGRSGTRMDLAMVK
jgi:hypothetical protein